MASTARATSTINTTIMRRSGGGGKPDRPVHSEDSGHKPQLDGLEI
jgi:hypothetical protein